MGESLASTPTDPAGSIMGVAARLDGDNRSWANLSDPNQGLKGYGYMYEANADNGRGKMVLALLWAGAYKDIGSQKVTLDNVNDYRFVLEVIGTTLHGQVFNLGPPEAPLAEPVLVAEDFRDVLTEPVMIDHDFSSSTPDAAHIPYTNGFSGVWGIGHVFYRDADYTIDNFRTETAAAGDYNRDGVTDAADYILWRKTLGEMGPTGNPPTAFGDLRANGSIHSCDQCQVIDEADYAVWRSGFGTSAVGSGIAAAQAAGVPEPASILLAVLGLATIWSTRRGAH